MYRAEKQVNEAGVLDSEGRGGGGCISMQVVSLH